MPEGQTTTFGSDRPLLYSVEPWKSLGFAVPNFGDNVGTLNMAIHNFADFFGQVQLAVMSNVDAQRRQAPTVNTIMMIAKSCNRARDILAARTIPYNTPELDGGHRTASISSWLIHPVPYFAGMQLRNHWMKEYNDLCMTLLTNMYQHSDNNKPLEISPKFAQHISRYIKRIARLIGSELLGISVDTINAEGFRFEDPHFQTYNPEVFTVDLESFNSPGPIQTTRTEDDLQPLMDGIPATLIYTQLEQYPVSGTIGLQGAAISDSARLTGVDEATAPAGGEIGLDQI